MSYLFPSLSKSRGFFLFNWILYLRENTTKILGSKISFYQCRCFKLLLWMGIKRVSKLPSLSWQKPCRPYLKFMTNGILPCTKEINPTKGPDGKMYNSPCSMCATMLWVELLLGKWGRVLSFLLHFSFLELYSILFLKLCLFLINGIFLWHIFAQCHNCQRMIPAYQSLVEFPWKCKWHETRIIPLQSGIWNHLKTRQITSKHINMPNSTSVHTWFIIYITVITEWYLSILDHFQSGDSMILTHLFLNHSFLAKQKKKKRKTGKMNQKIKGSLRIHLPLRWGDLLQQVRGIWTWDPYMVFREPINSLKLYETLIQFVVCVFVYMCACTHVHMWLFLGWGSVTFII